MRTLLKLCAIAGLLICASGCATNRAIVLDSNRDVVRLGRDIRGHVYVWQNGAWQLVGPVTLPEGWYAGPGPNQ